MDCKVHNRALQQLQEKSTCEMQNEYFTVQEGKVRYSMVQMYCIKQKKMWRYPHHLLYHGSLLGWDFI